MPIHTVSLSEDQIRLFHEQGYLSLNVFTSAEEVARLRDIFDRLFASRAGRDEGAHVDMVTLDDDDNAEPVLPAIINPVHYAPELARTQFRANAAHLARQLLGPTVTAAFEHAILKPAHYGAATPWHQDEATRVDANFQYEQVSFWMPLQDATVANGCMHYFPGTNLGEVLPHRSPNDDPRLHAIECAGGFDPADAVACEIPAGGVTIHHGRTLHGAGPNPTDQPRRAYILAFEIPPVPRATQREFPWNRGRQTAGLARRSRWRKKGGIAVELARKLRGGVWKSPGRLGFEVSRAVRALLKKNT